MITCGWGAAKALSNTYSDPGDAAAYGGRAVDPVPVGHVASDGHRLRDDLGAGVLACGVGRRAVVLVAVRAAGAVDMGCAARGRDSGMAAPSDWAPVAAAWDYSPGRARPLLLLIQVLLFTLNSDQLGQLCL